MPEGEPSKKKRSKFKTIDIDTEEVALILKYDVEVVLTTAEGESTVESRQSNQTKIRVKTLSETSNIEKIARQISDKCKQIPPAKVPLVITKLYELQMAVTGKGGGGSSTASPAAGTASAGSSPDNAAAERVAQVRKGLGSFVWVLFTDQAWFMCRSSVPASARSRKRPPPSSGENARKLIGENARKLIGENARKLIGENARKHSSGNAKSRKRKIGPSSKRRLRRSDRKKLTAIESGIVLITRVCNTMTWGGSSGDMMALQIAKADEISVLGSQSDLRLAGAARARHHRLHDRYILRH
eukprot:SAG31_NODE_2753_length_5141_cov_3.640619_9_plen_299_part_00